MSEIPLPTLRVIQALLVVMIMMAATVMLAPSVNAQSSAEVARDLIHSDLPIFGDGSDNEWPQPYRDGGSFGCASRVMFGDWAFRETDVDNVTKWYRFSNYGVFHCWANIFRAYNRSSLDGAEFYPSFFVFLSDANVQGESIELWTVQIGARPGSEYLLLSRAPDEGAIESFAVLQTECPRRNVRDAGALDILLTRYCAINSRADLTRLARRMAQRPPLGTLTRAPSNDGIAEGSHSVAR